jgi:hypothetical protein
MSSPAQFSLKPSASGQKAQPFVRPFLRLEAMFTALVVVMVGAIPVLLGLGMTLTTFWLGQQMIVVRYEDEQWWKPLSVDTLRMLLACAFSIFFWKQLLTRKSKDRGWLEVTEAEQPLLFSALHLLSELLRTPCPKTLRLDGSSKIQAEYSSQLGAFFGRGMRLRIGLCVPPGVTGLELLGLIAHEMSFYSRGTGSGWSRLTRSVLSWLRGREGTDDWTAWLLQAFKKGRSEAKPIWALLWAISWSVSAVLKGTSVACQLISDSLSRRSLDLADRCGAKVVGSEAMVRAIERKAQLTVVHRGAEKQLQAEPAPERLPDSLPLLVHRLLATREASNEANGHWMPCAQPTHQRVATVAKLRAPGLIQASGEGTDLFRNFHELARQATYFRYQNEWGLQVARHQLVAAEEIIHERRPSIANVVAINRYMKGAVHPERAFVGMATEHPPEVDSAVLRVELEDAREYMKTHQERISTVMTEWASSWRLVRDLEVGYQLARAGMPIATQQYAVRGNSPEAFQDEIEHQRHIMDAFEGMLREFEAKVETRISCALELLWREPEEELPAKLRALRPTLPHWVLIYEAMGLHMPVLRELMTQYNAFQSLGSSLAGEATGPSYRVTVTAALPRLAGLAVELIEGLNQWPYPFKKSQSEVEPLSHCLMPQEARSYLYAAARSAPLLDMRAVEKALLTLIDSYLTLFHEAKARVTSAADQAEWQLCPPPDPLAAKHTQPMVVHRMGPLLGRATLDPELQRGTLSMAN